MSKLYVVATPIGNIEDITLRALRILKSVDFIVCEERKMGARLLAKLEIKKPLEMLNEHNENANTPEILNRLTRNGETAALISDAGTPLFADPGANLVWQCHNFNIPVVPVPGASCLMTALMGSGVRLDRFVYYGFLPANKEERMMALKHLDRKSHHVFLDTPYRLKPVLRDMINVLGRERQGIIAYKLTQPEEQYFWGQLHELEKMTEALPKGEFVIILKGMQKKDIFNKKKPYFKKKL